MTLAHDVSASGGLRVPSGPTKVQSHAQVTHSCIPSQQIEREGNQETQSHTRLSPQSILLATALANISTPYGIHQVRALVDSGSEIALISENIINTLKLKRTKSRINISGIGGTIQIKSKGIVNIALQSLYNPNIQVDVQAHIIPTLKLSLPSFYTPPTDWPHLQGQQLADSLFLTPRTIDMIIGADHYGSIILPDIIYGSPHTPIAQSSIFGWLILGPVGHRSISTSYSTLKIKVDQDNQSIQDLLTKFWIQEEIPSSNETLRTPSDEECEVHFKTTHQRHSSGRYIVRIPLNSLETTLGDSYNTAYRCLHRQLKRLKRDLEYQLLYTQFMKEYEDLGHMVQSTQSKHSTHGYFMPHHGVLRPTSTTTKLRVVFNGSRPSTTGVSLNDITHTGEKIQLDITDVLLWVRQHRCLFATDITKMYRQIMVHPDDWHLQQILWLNQHNQITPFQLTTVTYGTRSAPYLAVRVLLQLVQDEGNNFPLASTAITKGRYVDDIFGGADSEETLVSVAKELIELCKKGCFPLAKWNSNNSNVLTQLFQSKCNSTPITFEDCNTKILGLNWNPLSDTFNSTSQTQDSGSKFTKRLILSEVAQIFDPLGFVSPTTVRAKMLLQELWLHNLSWDEQIPLTLAKRSQSIRDDLTNLNKITLLRWINSYSDSDCELHGFSDASQLAIAAAVYLKVHSPSTGPKITLICAKTKVAPLQKLTIPRLELTAALMLAKLTQYVQATLHVNINSTHLWTDSSVTLTWINTHAARWKDFVRNRVLQIQQLVPGAHWHHIPGNDNPADCASRGIETTQLINNTLWWSGPTWLVESKTHWPTELSHEDQACNLEARPGLSLVATTLSSRTQWDLVDRYSTLTKLIRITATIMKAVSIFKKRASLSPIITLNDLTIARKFWIKNTQAAYFTQELKTLEAHSRLPPHHSFTPLTAYIDFEGILRVGGRLQHSKLDPEGKHPAILPKHPPLTSLIIEHAHRLTLHGGVQLTLSTIRQQYWIIGGRYPIKSAILKCILCVRQRGIRAQQLMGQLPQARVTPSRPFEHTETDYAGPLTIKTWRGKNTKTLKASICVFVCMTTSAVHLELVSEYGTDAFIAAYRRFTSRRGICHTLYSDCGKNYIGANSQLNRLFTQYTQENKKVNSFLLDSGTRWSFNPPAAPHMGGKWKSVVKSTKYHLTRTVKDTLLTFEELTTLLTQIEALLNSRPLEPFSNDPDDLAALTPGHFLIGQPLTALPEPTITHLNSTCLSRWQLIQQRTQQFWSIWSKSYLQTLLARTKWFHEKDNIQVGSLVLLTDERFPPSQWPLARVIKTHPGPDGLTRIVTIKTATTTLTRPISKLAVLPLSSPQGTHPPSTSMATKKTDGSKDIINASLQLTHTLSIGLVLTLIHTQL